MYLLLIDSFSISEKSYPLGLDTTNGKTVKATVNGQPISDWRNHILKDKEQINLEISWEQKGFEYQKTKDYKIVSNKHKEDDNNNNLSNNW